MAPTNRLPAISVVGSGYVGLVTAACLARQGIRVTCVDVDAGRIAQIRTGEAPFYEPGLDVLLADVVRSGRLTATTDLAAAVHDTDITMVAVGTPSSPHGIDLSYVGAAVTAIGQAVAAKGAFHALVIKSTVVPGTTATFVHRILVDALGANFGSKVAVGVNPEFLREGTAIADFDSPDRIVLGANDSRWIELLKRAYSWTSAPILVTTPSSAELIKYSSNAVLATLISFANEIASIAEAVPDAHIRDVFRGLHLDRRWMPEVDRAAVDSGRIRPGAVEFLWPGCGYGGSCFPKDLSALEAHAGVLGSPARILRAVNAVNRDRAGHIVSLLDRAINGIAGKRLCVLGLAFKPGTDDVRESPGIRIAERLHAEGAIVTACDPKALSNQTVQAMANIVQLFVDPVEALKGADAALLVTPWPEFVTLEPSAYQSLMRTPVLFDTRVALDEHRFSSAGVKYLAIGEEARREALAVAAEPVTSA